MATFNEILNVLNTQRQYNPFMEIDSYPEYRVIDVTFTNTDKLVTFTFDDKTGKLREIY